MDKGKTGSSENVPGCSGKPTFRISKKAWPLTVDEKRDEFTGGHKPWKRTASDVERETISKDGMERTSRETCDDGPDAPAQMTQTMRTKGQDPFKGPHLVIRSSYAIINSIDQQLEYDESYRAHR